MADNDNDSMPIGRVAFENACVSHRKVIYNECFRKLKAKVHAEEATSEALIKALSFERWMGVGNIQAWLRAVARNTAIDYARELARERSLTVPLDSILDREGSDPIREGQVRMDCGAFLGQAAQFLPIPTRGDVALYREPAELNITLAQQAKRLGISLDQLRNRRRKVRQAVRAEYLITVLDDASPCAQQLKPSEKNPRTPRLLKEILAHEQDCQACSDTLRDANLKIRALLLAGSGLGVTGGVLERILRLITAKSAMVVAGAAAVSITAGVLITVPRPTPPHHGWAYPVAPTRTINLPPTVTAGGTITRNPPPSVRPSIAKERPARPKPVDPKPEIAVPREVDQPESHGEPRDERKRDQDQCERARPVVLVLVRLPGGLQVTIPGLRGGCER